MKRQDLAGHFLALRAVTRLLLKTRPEIVFKWVKLRVLQCYQHSLALSREGFI
jgi:hypothetical protein